MRRRVEKRFRSQASVPGGGVFYSSHFTNSLATRLGPCPNEWGGGRNAKRAGDFHKKVPKTFGSDTDIYYICGVINITIMKEMIRKHLWRLAVVIALLCGPAVLTACGTDDNPVEQTNVTEIANQVWEYAKAHPDGFTLDIRTMKEPTEGIAVSYAATQDSHSREQLDKVVKHALEHDGYVGGWLNSENQLYYFDSTRLFPEDQLEEALKFGKENGQYSVFILSTGTECAIE